MPSEREGKMERALREVLPFVEHHAARVAPGHSCGPDSRCDGNCVDAARDAELILQIKDALKVGAGPSGADLRKMAEKYACEHAIESELEEAFLAGARAAAASRYPLKPRLACDNCSQWVEKGACKANGADCGLVTDDYGPPPPPVDSDG
jgi:hypothetical protein